MTEARPSVRLSRLALMGLIVIAPLFGSGAVRIILVIVSAVSAYDGFNRATVYGFMTALIGTELIYGMDVGVISIAYMVAVLLVALLSRVVTIVPSSSEPGWHFGDGIRSLLTACGLFAVISALSVMLGSLLYGYEDIGLRLHGLTDPWAVVTAFCGLVVILIILRRIDEPFRRRIMFGI